MSATISVLGDLRIAGSVIMDQNNVNFPLNPRLGTLVVKGLNLYAYLNIGSMQTWYPLISIGGNNYVHTQAIPSQEWVVTHNLNTALYWYQIQDELGEIVSPMNVINIDSNSFRVIFSTPVTGSIVVVSTSNMIVDQINASLISLGADVTIDTAGMLIAGRRVLTGVTLAIGNGIVPQFTHTNEETLHFKAGLGINLAFSDVDKSVTITSTGGAGSTVTPSTVDQSIATAIAAEVAARNDVINTEAQERIAQDTATRVSLSSETAARIAGDALLVPKTTTVNGQALSSNISLSASDVGAASLAGNTFTGGQSIAEVNGIVINGVATFLASDSNKQNLTVSGDTTLALGGWPTTGIFGELLLELINAGAFVVTMPVVNWILPTNGAPAVSFADYLTAIGRTGGLQMTGTDFLYFWTSDNGATVYGKIM
jgi:hypothetical protein